MLTIEQALERCLGAVRPVRVEQVLLYNAVGRVLARDVVAPLDLPPWDNSAMDGFAVRSSDGPGRREVIETIQAGSMPGRSVAPGEAARIMTGAPLPVGADAVVMFEDTEPDGDGTRMKIAVRAGENVRRKSEDIRAGTTVLTTGTTMNPARVGMCAALGLTEVSCARRPTVGVLSTGNEIVPAGLPLRPGQIYSSNVMAIVGQVLVAGGAAYDCGVARDDVDDIRAVLERASELDIIVSTGGVSVGDFDLVRQVLEASGPLDFWKVRMKPGKPLAFGHVGTKPFFGLPGNPVSCFVNFLQFVRPVIRASLGDPNPYLPVLDAVLEGPLKKGVGREELIRVALRWEGGRLMARHTGGQGSHMLSSIAGAHGLALLGKDATGAEAGAVVPVQVFDMGFLDSREPGYRW